jgi:O-glycosyl hydrolase
MGLSMARLVNSPVSDSSVAFVPVCRQFFRGTLDKICVHRKAVCGVPNTSAFVRPMLAFRVTPWRQSVFIPPLRPSCFWPILVLLVLTPGRTATADQKAPFRTKVQVDASKTFQQIDGFGASDCWTLQKVGGWSEASKQRVADLLFSTTEGIGLSQWRFNVGGGLDVDRVGNTWRTTECFEVAEGKYDWSRQAGQRWFLQAAKAHGVDQFVAFVNSPPRRMTKNGHVNCDPDGGSTNLKAGYEAQFARYLCDIMRHFRDNPDPAQRIDFDWVAPVNEPQWDWDGGSQEGNRAGNADLLRIFNALARELDRQALDTHILGPESGMFQSLWTSARNHGQEYGRYLELFSSDAALAQRMDYTIASHAYLADPVPHFFKEVRKKTAAAMADYPQWKLWQTEYCILVGAERKGGSGRDLGMDTALDIARVMHGDLTLANVSSWSWWIAMSKWSFKDGLIYTDWRDADDVERVIESKMLWAFGNFSRFLRPGSTRLHLNGGNHTKGLMASAWKTPEKDGMVLVFINMSERPCEVDLSTQGGETSGNAFTPYLTAAGPENNLRPLAPISIQAPVAVPPRSVLTLVRD